MHMCRRRMRPSLIHWYTAMLHMFLISCSPGIFSLRCKIWEEPTSFTWEGRFLFSHVHSALCCMKIMAFIFSLNSTRKVQLSCSWHQPSWMWSTHLLHQHSVLKTFVKPFLQMFLSPVKTLHAVRSCSSLLNAGQIFNRSCCQWKVITSLQLHV